MVTSLALDWVGRRLYIAQVQNTNLNIRVVTLDNLEDMDNVVNSSVSNDAVVKITLSPYIG